MSNTELSTQDVNKISFVFGVAMGFIQSNPEILTLVSYEEANEVWKKLRPILARLETKEQSR